jgi:hypothetical protein
MEDLSLCQDCPLKDTCGTAKMPGIILSCGKRAKYEAPMKEE